MPKRQIFYSFHFANDVMRVQQIRNIGALEDNKPVSPNEWEEVRKRGDQAIKNWIENNMANRSCVVVLVGSETSQRRWVRYEIEKAWNDGRGLMGIHVHNLKCPRTGTCGKGQNPFETFTLDGKPLSNFIQCYDPPSGDAYGEICRNLDRWVEDAIQRRNNLK